mmetsp:Transcript_14462/g.38098  ORF Transcript_14462/g.38098 Transcript_14462/m.38098 type:complete len:239 (-) Transcript_14462:396-1112(-)
MFAAAQPARCGTDMQVIIRNSLVVVLVFAFSGQDMDDLYDASCFVADPSRPGTGPGGTNILSAARLTGKGQCNLSGFITLDTSMPLVEGAPTDATRLEQEALLSNARHYMTFVDQTMAKVPQARVGVRVKVRVRLSYTTFVDHTMAKVGTKYNKTVGHRDTVECWPSSDQPQPQPQPRPRPQPQPQTQPQLRGERHVVGEPSSRCQCASTDHSGHRRRGRVADTADPRRIPGRGHARR